jgi:Fe2+ or Zn2+ uptake regulation protein
MSTAALRHATGVRYFELFTIAWFNEHMSSSPETQLREAGLRITSGRLAVIAALETHPHSDADTLWGIVRKDLPGISVQSVHNVLHDLRGAGLLRRIEPAGSSSRYERRLNDNHHHVVCTSCGRIADVDCVHGEAPCLAPSNTSGFVIDTAEVTFWGVCPECATAATAATATTSAAATSAAPAPGFTTTQTHHTRSPQGAQ